MSLDCASSVEIGENRPRHWGLHPLPEVRLVEVRASAKPWNTLLIGFFCPAAWPSCGRGCGHPIKERSQAAALRALPLKAVGLRPGLRLRPQLGAPVRHSSSSARRVSTALCRRARPWTGYCSCGTPAAQKSRSWIRATCQRYWSIRPSHFLGSALGSRVWLSKLCCGRRLSLKRGWKMFLSTICSRRQCCFVPVIGRLHNMLHPKW
mmetsp:Transcript_79935/g.226132  ORF Transcript_79935/g.226132 Transcript_79935/m.226132 type:complete len:207 (-) Transcript_79935:442-1062(-)